MKHWVINFQKNILSTKFKTELHLKINRGNYLNCLAPETMKLLESTKDKIIIKLVKMCLI